MSSNQKSAGGRAATDSAAQSGIADILAPRARLIQSHLPGKQVPAQVLHDLDALAQECCGQIDALVDAAVEALARNVCALQVRQLLLLIQDRSMYLGDEINCRAEAHGCNFIDMHEHEFADSLLANKTRSLATVPGGAA